MDTLHVFEAQLKKNDIQLKEKNKNYQWQEWVNSIIFTSVTLEVEKHQLSSKSTNFPFSRGYLRAITMLADTI